MSTRIDAFREVAKEAIESLGLTPVENYVLIAPDIDAVIVRAWVEPGKTFRKLYVDHEIVLMAGTNRKAVRDLLRYDLERCSPLRVEDL